MTDEEEIELTDEEEIALAKESIGRVILGYRLKHKSSMILSIDLVPLKKLIEERVSCDIELIAIDIKDDSGNFDVIFRTDYIQKINLTQKEYYEASK